MRILFIGGYPKGHERPFDVATLSGKRLRRMVEEVGLDANYLDLWMNEQEERKGEIDQYVISLIRYHKRQSTECIALGKWVHKCLVNHGLVLPCLPHPGSRRRSDRDKLRAGLEKLLIE